MLEVLSSLSAKLFPLAASRTRGLLFHKITQQGSERTLTAGHNGSPGMSNCVCIEVDVPARAPEPKDGVLVRCRIDVGEVV